MSRRITYLSQQNLCHCFGGELIDNGDLQDLVFDVSLLIAMGMRIVLIPGARPQIEKTIDVAPDSIRIVNGIRVTSADTLEAVKEACGAVRLSVEAAFSHGCRIRRWPAHPSMWCRQLHHRETGGRTDGVDYQHAGVVHGSTAKRSRRNSRPIRWCCSRLWLLADGRGV